jgi:hypothetical protein
MMFVTSRERGSRGGDTFARSFPRLQVFQSQFVNRLPSQTPVSTLITL